MLFGLFLFSFIRIVLVELIEFHKIQASQTAKKISNTLNFATHKSDPEVTHFINNIRDYEQD